MNESNSIGAATKLFGFIAEKAQSNRFSTTLNKMFKARGDDAMIIPMNIREDDLYYTVANMRKSQLMGAAIGVEYQKTVLELLDESDALVETCGFCDTIRIEEGRLCGRIAAAEAVCTFLRANGAKQVAVIGGGSLAKALALSAGELELHFFHESVEALMEMGRVIGRDDLDINRCAEGMAVDMGGFDAVVDACRMEHLQMITALPKLAVDLRAADAPSPLRDRARTQGIEYAGYEELLAYLTQAAYDIWMRTKENQ